MASEFSGTLLGFDDYVSEYINIPQHAAETDLE
jgi:hypothetical protein